MHQGDTRTPIEREDAVDIGDEDTRSYQGEEEIEDIVEDKMAVVAEVWFVMVVVAEVI